MVSDVLPMLTTLQTGRPTEVSVVLPRLTTLQAGRPTGASVLSRGKESSELLLGGYRGYKC